MATGEVGFSSRGRTAKTYVYEPLPKDDYELKLDLSRAEVTKKQGDPTAIPYLGGIMLEVMDSGKDGQNNRKVFHSLFTSITPTKNGNVSWDDMKGPQGLVMSLGQEIDVPAEAIRSYPAYNKETKEPTGKSIRIVDPKFLLGWLKQFDGQVIQGHLRIRRQKDQDPRNEVAYFIAPEGGTQTDAFSDKGQEDLFTDEPGEMEPEVEEVTVKAPSKPQKLAAAGKRK